MNLHEVIARQHLLTKRIDGQRAVLVDQINAFKHTISWVDKGLEFAQILRQQPLLSLVPHLLSGRFLAKKIPVLRLSIKLVKLAKFWFSLK